MTDLIKRMSDYEGSIAPPIAKGIIRDAKHALAAADDRHKVTLGMLDAANARIAELESALMVPEDALPPAGQDWSKVEPSVAFHLIERHAENWAHAGKLMEAWRMAVNSASNTQGPTAIVTETHETRDKPELYTVMSTSALRIGDRLYACPFDSRGPQADGYCIRHADGLRWRTLDSMGMPEWTVNEADALCFSLRHHADAFAGDDPEDVRIVPRTWVV